MYMKFEKIYSNFFSAIKEVFIDSSKNTKEE